MPPATYAILGATGQTGGSILQVLASERPDVPVNCLVRSRAKLERMYPDITARQQQASKLQVFEGNVSDIPLLTDCIRGTKAVFLCVAKPDNEPHLRIARDQAEAVVAALDALRTEQQQQQQRISGEKADGTATETKLPLLVMLSSAETDEARLCREIPWAVRRVLYTANWWVYTDLIAAERYLRDRADWVDAVFVKPGGIAKDVRRGHVLSTETSQTFVSFLDVAGGMVQCAEEGAGQWAGESVSVLSRGNAKIEWSAPYMLFRNLLCSFIPWLHPWLF
ncbi:flx ordb monooxygenase oxidase [Diaporthe amygdali]|uniref:flx ordb monooxygenase oxidase n=1 Tax=Phomopsis amygdali TaxID=1214568 RepID=UPI0022FDE489|nr:flx ordb monooxygenase oxidase [Diaporthe amygdali]KAJ0117775.1 flx ordb monooxygenase oxidase [Diaporthe amygdali]